MNIFRLADKKGAADRPLMSNISWNARYISMTFHATVILCKFLIYQLLKHGE